MYLATLERNPGAQPANPHPWSPPRRPSRDPHPTHRSQTNPAAKQAELEPDAGAPTRPTSPPSSPPRRPSRDPHPTHRSQTNPAAKQAELEPDAGAQPDNLPPLVAARHPSRDPYQLPLQDQPTQAPIQNQPTSGT